MTAEATTTTTAFHFTSRAEFRCLGAGCENETAGAAHDMCPFCARREAAGRTYRANKPRFRRRLLSDFDVCNRPEYAAAYNLAVLAEARAKGW